ncbi:MAG TPA: outer membrane protein assembly factor BamD, partial [Holophaga sp.]|nr:outer membrane protein assembly factor BamD [Holophaga sp.]
SPEYPQAKLLIGDSFFFAKKPSYPEAAVEYQNFLSYFPKHEMRDYALYHIALCHFSVITDAERDQVETRQALVAFQNLLKEAPASPYATDARAKITQCWRRLAESELMVGIFYAKTRHFSGAETRLKGMLEAFPEYADRERAYYYLGVTMSQRTVDQAQTVQFRKDFLARLGKDESVTLSKEEQATYKAEFDAYKKAEVAKYRQEARDDYQRLIESYPKSPWAKRAKHDLDAMGKAAPEA